MTIQEHHTHPATERAGGAYVDAAGLRTYYEQHGTGPALVLLHGGFCAIETFDGLTPALAEQFKVEPNIELAELAAITAHTLVLIGDDDLCTVEHAEAVRRALPVAQLAVVPGASHALPMEKPALTSAIVLDFLAG